jgi:hypothetical protein
MYVANKPIAQLLPMNIIQDSIFIPYTKLENLKENTIALEREGYSSKT